MVASDSPGIPLWHVLDRLPHAIPNGVLLSEESAIAEIAEIASAAEQFGEQITVDLARTAHGITLVYRGGSDRDAGARLLQELHDAARRKRYTIPGNLPLSTSTWHGRWARRGDVDGAIELARTAFDDYLRSGEIMWLAVATAVLVESLLQRGIRGRPAGSTRCDRETGGRADRTRRRPERDLAAAASGPAGTGRRRRRSRIATSATAIARWPTTWASRAIWRGPRRWCDLPTSRLT